MKYGGICHLGYSYYLSGDIFMKRKLFLSFRLKEFFFGLAAIVLCCVCVCLIDFNYFATAMSQSLVRSEKLTVIVDPGHGDFDGGTQSESGIIEKDVNLEISLKLKEMLCLSGYNVVMTRSDDTVLNDKDAVTIRQKKSTDLKNRLKLIESYPDCIFISIHQNYFTESKYSGTQVFYSGNNPESETLANAIQQSVIENVQTDNTRQTKKSGSEIFLLYKAQCPAIMIECGFLSNENETQMLTDEQYQKKLVAAIVAGIIKYEENIGDENNGSEK